MKINLQSLKNYFSDITAKISNCRVNNFKDTGSHRRWCSIKNSVLKNLAKFTGKHLCQSLFFDKVTSLRPATLLKKRL